MHNQKYYMLTKTGAALNVKKDTNAQFSLKNANDNFLMFPSFFSQFSEFSTTMSNSRTFPGFLKSGFAMCTKVHVKQ